ncbi:hypothetical protein HMF8227_02562 [Saliniradius amylolyticus]|uniref:Uncharacterized protein n=1 Tax=Saliniradius amylolyticus TaxID=2183582 RepID=A0A2S2E5T1_9ALTE|nr:hypothetical protein [Saliniradius amylolyticus]AWL13014.1 hypothetical protein HMF8227_02562 [Saliniradius amylolyticus]
MKKLFMLSMLVLILATVIIMTLVGADEKAVNDEVEKELTSSGEKNSPEPALIAQDGYSNMSVGDNGPVSEDPSEPEHSRVDNQKALSPSFIQTIVNPDFSSVNKEKAGQVLSADNFTELLEEIRDDQNVSLATEKYQQGVMDYFNLNGAANYSSDYRLNCNDQLCLTYFSADRQEDVDKVIQLINSENVPMHSSGFQVLYIAQEDGGRQSVRAVFNADPAIDSIRAF